MLSRLTSHPVSIHPSVCIPSPSPTAFAAARTRGTGCSDCQSRRPRATAQTSRAATQPRSHPLPYPLLLGPASPSHPPPPPPPRSVTCLGGVRQVVATDREVSEFPTTEAQDAGVARLLQGPVQAPHGVLRLEAPRVPLRPIGERLTEKSRYRDGHQQCPAAGSPSGSATSPSGRATATATSTSTTTAAPTVNTTSLTRRHVPGRENSPRQYSTCAASVGGC